MMNERPLAFHSSFIILHSSLLFAVHLSLFPVRLFLDALAERLLHFCEISSEPDACCVARNPDGLSLKTRACGAG